MLTFVSGGRRQNMGFIMAEIAEKTENTVHIKTDGFSDRETKNDQNIQEVI